jgi:hypothetical protein
MAATDTDTRRTARFSHIFARLLELHNYVWDPEIEPFHSSYDNWHFFGYEKTSHERPSSRSALTSPILSHSYDSSRPGLMRSHRSSGSDTSAVPAHTHAAELQREGRPVVCRVSTHTLRLEREFQLSKVVVKGSDPDCKHFVRPIEFVRLSTKSGEEPLVASIFEAPGKHASVLCISSGYRIANFVQVLIFSRTWSLLARIGIGSQTRRTTTGDHLLSQNPTLACLSSRSWTLLLVQQSAWRW